MNMRRLMSGLCVMVMAVVTVTAGAEMKLVSNADVVAMINAGLPESTIIMAIKQGPAGFDTSPMALIELKNQGATAGMLEAMMQSHPSNEPTPAKKGTGNALLDAYNQEMSGRGEVSLVDGTNSVVKKTPKGKVVEGGGVILVDGNNRVRMKYAFMESESRGKANVIRQFVPFVPSKLYRKLDGQHSACRIVQGAPSFEFNMSRDVQPTTRVALIALAVRNRDRIIQISSSGFTGISNGFPKKRIIPIKITEIQAGRTAAASWQTRYVVTPETLLTPGEYALVFGQHKAYDFGVDGAK